MSSVIATRPPIIAPAPRPVTRDDQRAADPAASAIRPRAVTIPGILGARMRRHAAISRPRLVGSPCHPDVVSQQSPWGRPAGRTRRGLGGRRRRDVRIPTRAGPHRQRRRAGGRRRRQRRTQRLQPAEPRCRPRAHACARPDRRDARRPADASPTSPPELIEVLRGRTLVAHNVGFDYSFLAAEAELAGVGLPIDTVMCTVELARRLDLGCRQPAAGDAGRALGHQPDEAARRARRRAGAGPDPQARAGPGARAQGVAAGAAGGAAALAQRADHPRGAASAQDDRVADAVPVSEPGPVRRAADRSCRACASRCRPR